MSEFNNRGVLGICAVIVLLFGAIELYGVYVVGDWSIVVPTVVCQLLAITVAVAPMMYGFIYASGHDE